MWNVMNPLNHGFIVIGQFKLIKASSKSFETARKDAEEMNWV